MFMGVIIIYVAKFCRKLALTSEPGLLPVVYIVVIIVEHV